MRLRCGLCALAAVVATASCKSGDDQSRNRAAEAPAPTVTVAEVVRQTVPLYREYVGRTDANLTVDVRPQVTGILQEAPFAEGQPVRKGDVLFRIDPRQFETAVQTAEAEVVQTEAAVEQARAQLGKAQQDVARYEPLAKQRAIPQQDYENAVAAQRVAEAQVAQALANVQAATTAVRQAKLNLSYAVIRSPITGIIGQRQVDPGNLVSAQMTNPLVSVSSSNPIRVGYDVSDVQYMQFAKRTGVRPGTRLRNPATFVLLLPDGTTYPHRGRFFMVERAVTAETGTLRIIAEFPNPTNLLRPGQFVRVRVTSEQLPSAVLVPQTAVQEMLGTSSVIVVTPDNKTVQRTVGIQGPFENSYIVTEGLQGGERVIVEGQQKVRPGMVVRPQQAAAAAAGA